MTHAVRTKASRPELPRIDRSNVAAEGQKQSPSCFLATEPGRSANSHSHSPAPISMLPRHRRIAAHGPTDPRPGPQTIIATALRHGTDHKFQPLAVVVLDARGVLKAYAAEDGTSLRRSRDRHGQGARRGLSFGHWLARAGQTCRDHPALHRRHHPRCRRIAGSSAGRCADQGQQRIPRSSAAVGISGDNSGQRRGEAAIAGITAAGPDGGSQRRAEWIKGIGAQPILHRELLGDDPFGQRAVRIEQHAMMLIERSSLTATDTLAHFGEVGDRGSRTLVGLQHLEGHLEQCWAAERRGPAAVAGTRISASNGSGFADSGTMVPCADRL